MTTSIEARINNTNLQAKLNRLTGMRDQAMPAIYEEFVKNTPRDTGSARENTTYHSNVIEARYPYASVLDEGRGFRDGQMRGSDQAPHGMVEPTLEFAKRMVPQLVGKLGK